MADNRPAYSRPVVRWRDRGTASACRATEIGVRMTNGGMSRSLVPGIMLKIGLPLLIGLITLVAAWVGGMPGRNSLALAAVVAFGSALILFIVDTEMRISAVYEHMAEGFAKLGRSAEPFPVTDRSIVDGALLTDLLHTASQSDERVNALLQRLARREME